MTVLSSFYAISFLCNCLLVSSSILTPLKTDGSLRIFKESPNEFEYVLKRHSTDGRSEDPDSKERRSNAGSSFIRFGRSGTEGNLENAVLSGDVDGDSKVNRYPRWKSPDIVIRFGRSGERGYERGRNDLNFIRFGRELQNLQSELEMTPYCRIFLSQSAFKSKEIQPLMPRLVYMCNSLSPLNDERRDSFDFPDGQTDAKHE